MSLPWLSRKSDGPAVRSVAAENHASMEALNIAGLSLGEADLDRLEVSVRIARRFAGATSARAAWRVLPERVRAEACAQLADLDGHFCLSVRSGSLLTLALIAWLANRGWTVIAEDGRFSREYLNPFLVHVHGKCSALTQMPRRFLDLNGARSGDRHMFVTFADRPLGTYEGTLLVQSRLGAFHMSDADALLAELPFDQVRPIAPASADVSADDGGAESTSEQRLANRTDIYFQALSAEIGRSPTEYLAWRQLAARSQQFQRRVAVNGRAILKGLLFCAKIRGHCRDAGAHADVLRSVRQLPKTC